MTKSVWRTHGNPIDRVAKRGLHYEPEPETPSWILRDRTKDGLAEQFLPLFARISAAASDLDLNIKDLAKRRSKLHPLDDADRVIALLKQSTVIAELFEFSIRVVEGNIGALQRLNRWNPQVRELFVRRLALLRRRVDEEFHPAFDQMLSVAKAPSSSPRTRPTTVIEPMKVSKRTKANSRRAVRYF